MHTISIAFRLRLESFSSKQIRPWLLLGFLLCAFPSSAQDCTAYEKELEEYFLAHQADDKLNISRIEDVYKACSMPSDKMELIYYYFQAVHAINSAPNSYRDYRTYEAATFFYDQAAQYFPYLIQVGREEDTFVETYFAKAFVLEQWLQQQARKLRYSPENRYYGELEGEVWARAGDTRGSGQKRGADAEEVDFKRKFRQDGQYIDELPPYYETSAGWEAFGYVGSVEDLTLIDYLDWQRRDIRPGQEFGDPDFLYSDPYEWISSLHATPGAYVPLMSIQDEGYLRQLPNSQSAVVAKVGFGEVLARVTGDMPVYHNEVTFLPVLNELGQRGWIDRNRIVEEGRLAVCITNTSAYQQINARSDRNAVLFFAGELLVLEGARDNWIRVVGRNARKRGWIAGPDILSIDPVDLFIGNLMYRALQYDSSVNRINKLEEIRQVPGFYESGLSPYVERLINQSRS